MKKDTIDKIGIALIFVPMIVIVTWLTSKTVYVVAGICALWVAVVIACWIAADRIIARREKK